MGFPIFDMPFVGNPLLIALDAILHVFISHGVAIGAGTMIVVAEWVGFRRGAPEWDRFARRMLAASVVVVVAVGAPTGAGIWFITSVIAPRGIGSLLRVFFWPWFVEWLVFTGEVILLLVYHFTWERWSGPLKRRHVRVGLAYVAFSLATAVLITGILGFMLTPDGWPWDERLAKAFLNPTYPAMLAIRLGAAFLLGAIYAAGWLAATRQEPAFRADALRVIGRIGAAGAAVAALGGAAYAAAVPAPARPFFLSSWGTRGFAQAPALFWILNGVAAALVVLFLARALLGASRGMRGVAAVSGLAALAVVAQLEFVRESLRKPYLLPGHLYVNQLLLTEVPLFRERGLLRSAYWYNAAVDARSLRAEGAYLFMQSCSRCHGVDAGFNAIQDRVRGRTADALYAILGHADEMVPFMPPFAGTEDERRILAEFLFDLGAGRIPPESVARYTIRDGGRAP